MASGDDTLPSSPDDDPPPPLQLGRYQILGQLGAGGAGIVLAALDPTLHRKVALKVLRPRPASGGDGDTRLEFEAQAMAQLAHPNVVTVFEVGRVGDQVYVAMELVEGSSLRGWMKTPHGWREVVETFVAAGRGLVAAHTAGLIHRDFKPDNVMLGSDGRPRVTDFGLVIHSATDGNKPPESDELISNTSFRGGVVGTPAYMAAEQWDGRTVDARSDQFAFCVSLWEALFGRRPFVGERVAELRSAVQRGAIVEPGDRRVPRWLVAVLRRGLAADPAARWPTMAALLARLERGLHRRRSTAVAIAAVGLGALAVGFAVAQARRVPDPCAPPAERIAAVWSPGRGELLRLRLALIDPAEGGSRFVRIAGALDGGTRSWSAMHVDACRATRVDGRQSDTLLDRRMTCLDRWLGELATTVTAIEQVRDRGSIDQAVHAAHGSPLDACADQRALAEAPLPASAADRATAALLARETAGIEVATRAGRLDGLPARASSLVAAARTLGHAPTLSAALAAQARVLYAISDEAKTLPILRELVLVAARAHSDRDEAFAWTNLMLVIADNEGKLEEALALVPSASAAVLRAGDPVDLRADLLYYQGTVLDGGPEPALGRARLTEARQLLEKAGAGGPGSPLTGRLADVLFEIGTSYIRTGDTDQAIVSIRAAIERWRAAYGNDTVDEAYGWHNLGATLVRSGKLDDARAAFAQAVRIREARLGDSPALAISLVGLASVFDEEGQWERSLELYDHALRIDRATLAPGDLHFGNPMIGRAIALANLDRLDDAARGYDEVVGLFEQAGGKTINFAIALANRAHLARRRGHCDDAIRDAARAITMMEGLVEPTGRWLIYPLVEQAACVYDGGHAKDAIPLLERALRCKADAGVAVDVARARSYLGRALVETGRDRAGGLVMVKASRATINSRPENADEVRQLDRWLAH